MASIVKIRKNAAGKKTTSFSVSDLAGQDISAKRICLDDGTYAEPTICSNNSPTLGLNFQTGSSSAIPSTVTANVTDFYDFEDSLDIGASSNTTTGTDLTATGTVVQRALAYGNAAAFPGSSGNYLAAAAIGSALSSAVNGSTLTISFWLYIDVADTTGRTLIDLGNGSGVTNLENIWVYLESGGNTMIFNFYNASASYLRFYVTEPTAETWTHYAIVLNGSGSTLYVNGVAASPTYAVGSASTAYIGHTPTRFQLSTGSVFGVGLDGALDKVFISSTSMTATDVLNTYNYQRLGGRSIVFQNPVSSSTTIFNDNGVTFNSSVDSYARYLGRYSLYTNTLALYDDGTTTAAHTVAQTTEIKLTKLDDNVTLTCSGFSGTKTGTGDLIQIGEGTNIPSGFRPVGTRYAIIKATSSTSAAGYVSIDSSGNIILYATVAGGTFGASVSADVDAFSIVYSIS